MVRIIHSLIASALCAGFTQADEYRHWKEADGDRTIHARLIDKKKDDKRQLQLRLLLKKSAKGIWVPASKLAKEDQEYAERWLRPEERMTIKGDANDMKAASKGDRKNYPTGKIEIIVKKSTEPMTLKLYEASGKQPIEMEIPALADDEKPGESKTLRKSVPSTFYVELFREDGSLLAKQNIKDLKR